MPVYYLVVYLYSFAIRIASLFSQKAKLWVKGRINVNDKIIDFVNNNRGKKIWFHAASLGEFEQGRPLIELIKKNHPELKIVLTFFSPSGYEMRKNYECADLVLYLPADTIGSAEKFVSLLNPDAVIFIKYEFWLGYLNEIQKKSIPLFLVSAIFRPNQIFFKPYGWIFKRALIGFNRVFVQDKASEKLLIEIGFNNVECCGDTRIDRVLQIAGQEINFPLIEKFKNNHHLMIAGSTWPEDLDCLLPAIQRKLENDNSFRLIIAPHDISKQSIQSTIAAVSKFIPKEKASVYTGELNPNSRVLILDTMGMLSMVYAYANSAYVGGGFGNGIHSTLEPAAFNLPIVFGPKHHKFKEASEMIAEEIAFEVRNSKEFSEILEVVLKDENVKKININSKSYMGKHRGATERIYTFMNNSVFNTFKG